MNHQHYLTLNRLRELMDKYGCTPSKSLGQHFLVDPNIVDIILSAGGAGLSENAPRWACDIGAGPGILTLPLSHSFSRVLAVEIDRGIKPLLQEVTSGRDNVDMVFADARDICWEEVLPEGESVAVFGNLPYGAAPPIINHLLESDVRWESAVFMLQKEVAERLAASPGGKDYGTLTLAVCYFAQVSIVHQVSPNCFWPPPEVHSALVKLAPRSPRPPVEFSSYIWLVRSAFNWRRKTIRNALRNAISLPEAPDVSSDRIDCLLHRCGVDRKARGETLPMGKYVDLAVEWEEMIGGQ